MKNLPYPILTAVLSNDTLKILFPDLLEFVAKHRWIFIESHFEVIAALQSNSVSVAMLMSINGMMEQVAAQEAEKAEQDADEKEWNDKVTASKASR
jgi:hypothetical protein